MKPTITVTISSVQPHPNPQRLMDIWTQLMLRELLQEGQQKQVTNP